MEPFYPPPPPPPPPNTIARASFSSCEYCFSAEARERDAKAIGFSSPLGNLWEITAPRRYGEASHAMMMGLLGS